MGAPTMGIAQSSIAQPATPAGPSVDTSPSTPAPASPTLDATALANIAAYLQKTGQSITSDQGRIGQLNQQDPIQQLKLMTVANAGGGLYGSAYGQQQGNLTAQQNYNIGQLQNAIAGLQASEPIYESQQAADSADRAAAAAAKSAPAPITTPAPAAPSVSSSFPSSTVAHPESIRQIARSQGKANANQLKQKGTPKGGFR